MVLKYISNPQMTHEPFSHVLDNKTNKKKCYIYLYFIQWPTRSTKYNVEESQVLRLKKHSRDSLVKNRLPNKLQL